MIFVKIATILEFWGQNRENLDIKGILNQSDEILYFVGDGSLMLDC